MVSGKSKSPSLKSRRAIFVTGASGYLGQHFLKLAKHQPWELRCLARSPLTTRGANVIWIKGDIRYPRAWSKALEGCDTVVHLATVPLGEAERHPKLARDVIVKGVHNLFTQGQKHLVSRYIVASTSEVYGSSKKPIAENSPLEPESNYGLLKSHADLYALSRADRYNVSVSVLRFFNLYGLTADGELPATVIKSFADCIITNNPVVLHASVRNSRDFTHVSDAAHALILAVQKCEARGLFNIGSGKELTLRSLAGKVSTILGKKLSVDFRPHEGRHRRLVAQCARARKKLGYRVRVPFDQGLREVLKTYIN